MPLRNSIALAALIILIDQLTKGLVLMSLPLHTGIEVSGFFNLVHVRNEGAAFSLLANQPGWQRLFFIVLALGVSMVLLHLLRKPAPRLVHTSYALILGGALGNVIDRVIHGNVVDFLDFYIPGWHWPAFNGADSAITVGAVLLILAGFRNEKSGKP